VVDSFPKHVQSPGFNLLPGPLITWDVHKVLSFNLPNVTIPCDGSAN
jgi:hypothetical protein